jgi:hypothetical protein
VQSLALAIALISTTVIPTLPDSPGAGWRPPAANGSIEVAQTQCAQHCAHEASLCNTGEPNDDIRCANLEARCNMTCAQQLETRPSDQPAYQAPYLR